jgi:hypothetical protein
MALALTVSIFTSTEVKAASSTHGTKWTDYTDPYGRYTIKYPSKWSIQSEPVHTGGNYVLEVPFKVRDSHASSLTVMGTEKSDSLTLREYTSLYQNTANRLSGLPTKVEIPVSCGYLKSDLTVPICEYGQIDTIGFNEIAERVMIFSAPQNRVFVLTLVYGPYEPLGGNSLNSMFESFRVLGQSGDVTTTTGQGTTYSDWTGENSFDKDIFPCVPKVQDCHTYQLK